MSSHRGSRGFILVFILSACGSPQSTAEATAAEGVTVKSEQLTYGGNGPWPGSVIPVCWEGDPRNSQDVLDRQTVQREVENAWEQETGVQFSGWGKCPLVTFGVVRIVVNDSAWPRTSSDGIVLTIPFNAPEPPSGTQFSGGGWAIPSYTCPGRDICLIETVIHEFGHVLRYKHEQARLDTPSTCTARQVLGEPSITGFFGSAVSMPWDEFSIMNYCNTASNRQLSGIDIAGTTFDYGHIRSIAAVSMRAGREDVFFRGRDNQLVHYSREGTSEGVESLGGFIVSAPAVVSPATGQIVVFALGAFGHMFRRSYSGSSWSNWERLGGDTDTFEGDPAASVSSDGVVTVVARTRRARGVGTTLVPRLSASRGGAAFVALSISTSDMNRPTGAPAVVSFSSNAVLVLYRTFSGRLVATRFDGAWKAPDGTSTSAVIQELSGPQSTRASPSAVRNSDGTVSVLSRNLDGSVQHLRINPTIVESQNLNGTIFSSPSVVSFGPDRLDVFVRGTDSGLYHAYRNAPQTGFAGWFSLGQGFGGGFTGLSTGWDQLAVYARSANGKLMIKRWTGAAWEGFSSEIPGTDMR